MLKTSGNRLVFFLFGVSVGLLIGAGFFIFKIDEYISRMELFKEPKQDTVIVSETAPRKKTQKNPVRTNKGPGDVTTPGKGDGDSLKTMRTPGPDSLGTDSAALSIQEIDEEIKVKKDEMLSSAWVTVSGDNSSAGGKDSLMRNLSGIRDDKSPKSFQVEFWSSPLNYKGYKMTRNKIVLFGLNPPGEVGLYRIDNHYYLKHQQSCYRVEFTGDFKNFEKVSDAAVVAKMN